MCRLVPLNRQTSGQAVGKGAKLPCVTGGRLRHAEVTPHADKAFAALERRQRGAAAMQVCVLRVLVKP